jgi:hypothetical protein
MQLISPPDQWWLPNVKTPHHQELEQVRHPCCRKHNSWCRSLFKTHTWLVASPQSTHTTPQIPPSPDCITLGPLELMTCCSDAASCCASCQPRLLVPAPTCGEHHQHTPRQRHTTVTFLVPAHPATALPEAVVLCTGPSADSSTASQQLQRLKDPPPPSPATC